MCDQHLSYSLLFSSLSVGVSCPLTLVVAGELLRRFNFLVILLKNSLGDDLFSALVGESFGDRFMGLFREVDRGDPVRGDIR